MTYLIISNPHNDPARWSHYTTFTVKGDPLQRKFHAESTVCKPAVPKALDSIASIGIANKKQTHTLPKENMVGTNFPSPSRWEESDIISVPAGWRSSPWLGLSVSLLLVAQHSVAMASRPACWDGAQMWVHLVYIFETIASPFKSLKCKCYSGSKQC